MPKMPTHLTLLNPTLEALHELGGSATNAELVEHVLDSLSLPDAVVNQLHGKGSQTEVEYRLAWARNYLKNFGLLENPSRTVWALTAEGARTQAVDPRAVSKFVRDKVKAKKAEGDGSSPEDDASTWREQLLETLHAMPPDAFERLCQRVLRESGFTEVEVTGRTGDGGIDGHGIFRLGGMISFTVVFQAKRYQSNIGSSVVRDFRGAMVGRADKGVIITTANFTRDARGEATRDGAPPIDLVTGDDLADKLKDLRLGVGVTERVVEDVTIQTDWFNNL